MVNAIAVVGNTVVLGGDFDWIGGQLQDHLAAADVTTGALLPWKPNPDWPVFSLVVWGTTMIVGGEFYFIADTPHSRLAAFDFAPTASAGPTPGDPHPLRSVPNPFSARTRIRFDVSDRREVSLGVYDLSGRQVASLLDRQRLEPGPHEVEFDGRGLRAGLYFCRLTTGSIAQTAKILHVD
jgi:hypothetical protein